MNNSDDKEKYIKAITFATHVVHGNSLSREEAERYYDMDRFVGSLVKHGFTCPCCKSKFGIYELTIDN